MAQESTVFLHTNDIQIMLITETHFTNRNFIRIKGYSSYEANHPENKSKGGSMILIQNGITHYELEKICEKNMQATSTQMIQEGNRSIAVSSVYCPPRFNITKVQFETLFSRLGPRYIIGGDCNAKHVTRRSKQTTTRGKQLHDAILSHNCHPVTTGKPTAYWPADRNRIPDLIQPMATLNIDMDEFRNTVGLYIRNTNTLTVEQEADLRIPIKNIRRDIRGCCRRYSRHVI